MPLPRPPRTGRKPHAGFTLVEVLTALVLMGMLMALIGGVMAQMVDSSAALEERLPVSEESIALRRLLHRDLMNITDPETFGATAKGFGFMTVNSHLRGVPLEVKVEWSFDLDRIVRREESSRLQYSKEIVVMPKAPSSSLEFYLVDRKAWVGRSTAYALALRTDNLAVGGLRLKLRDGDGGEVEIIERLRDG